METTVILLKPDCLAAGNAGEVIRRLETAGFVIRGCKMIQLTTELLREHYSHLLQLPFYPEIETFMMSRPVIAMAIAGDHVVERIRDLLGPTNSTKAPKGTIRGDLGVDVMRNVVHASDGLETAAAELQRFFQPGELFDVPGH